jgi:transposase
MLETCKIRDIIRTNFIMDNPSASQIAKLCRCSRQSVTRIVKKARKYKLTYPVIEELKDSEITRLLYPALHDRVGSRRELDYASIYKESLKRNGKTTTVLYLEYRAIAPDSAYSKTQFFYLIRRFLKKCHLAMRQQHQAGEVLFIDYAGTGVCYQKAGGKVWLKVFVACLGASKKLFAFATTGERSIDWLNGMTKMLEYYGGVPEVISIDNARGLVSKPGLIPVLVKNVALFGEYYDCIIDSCRVGAPQDKSLAELGVKFVKQRILIRMNSDMTFHSIDEVNDYLLHAVEQLNEQPFQKLNTTRNKLFHDVEKSELGPLPATSFEAIFDFKCLKVPATYHLLIDQHEYSVPHTLAQESVEVLVTQSHVKVMHDNKLVAEHVRSDDVGSCTTVFEHMPPQHQAESLKTKAEYLSWAKMIGGSAESYIESLYTFTKSDKSRAVGKQCQTLVKLCVKEGHTRFNKACNYALRHKVKPAEMKLVLSALEELNPPEMTTSLLIHKNIRGKGNFGGRHEY